VAVLSHPHLAAEFEKVADLLDALRRCREGAPGSLIARGSAEGLVAGTQVVLELSCHASLAPAAAMAELLAAPTPLGGGRLELAVRYSPEPVSPGAVALGGWASAGPETSPQQRRHPRVPVNVLAADAADQSRQFLVRDLSLGGMGVVAQERTAPAHTGAAVRIPLELQPGLPVNLHGAVVWAREGEARFGIAFPKMGELEKAAVRLLMQRRRAHRLDFDFADGERF
jgi:hypothetical protein